VKKTSAKFEIFFLPSLGEKIEKEKNPTYELRAVLRRKRSIVT
jgi:hypothetical protein